MASQQDARVIYLQGVPGTPATANGNGTPADFSGVDGAAQVEVVESNGGTATLNLEGSFDGTTWYAIGYQQIDNTASPARAVAAVSILANSSHVYQILDPYPQLRARLSSVATSPKVAIRAYLVST